MKEYSSRHIIIAVKADVTGAENVLFAGTRHIIIAVKVDVTGGKMYCLQARPCIFQLGSFTGWGSEGVN